MKSVTKEEFDKKINASEVVLVDMFATWCGPCQMMVPAIEEIKDEYAKDNKVEVIGVDIDESPDISSKYSVMSVPTFLLFKDGKLADSVIGAVAKDILVEKLEKLIK